MAPHEGDGPKERKGNAEVNDGERKTEPKRKDTKQKEKNQEAVSLLKKKKI